MVSEHPPINHEPSDCRNVLFENSSADFSGQPRIVASARRQWCTYFHSLEGTYGEEEAQAAWDTKEQLLPP